MSGSYPEGCGFNSHLRYFKKRKCIIQDLITELNELFQADEASWKETYPYIFEFKKMYDRLTAGEEGKRGTVFHCTPVTIKNGNIYIASLPTDPFSLALLGPMKWPELSALAEFESWAKEVYHFMNAPSTPINSDEDL